MDKTKAKIIRFLTLLFLLIFPFGQLFRKEVFLLSTYVTLHPIDIIIGLIFLVLTSGYYRKPYFYKSMMAFIIVVSFSFILSSTIFGQYAIIKGFFYLLRLISYLFFFVALFNVVKGNEAKNTLYISLVSVAAITGVFGWLQYFWLPDLRSLYYIGWDDHLNRLIGTFLDPGFTSIILVFGFLLSLLKFLQEKRKSFLILSLFFLLTVAFTYARAAFIALLAGAYLISRIRKSFRPLWIVGVVLSLFILILPRPEGYGVKLERTHSIYAKLVNYRQTLSIIKKSPLLGVGFNNICVARERYLGDYDTFSHACSGADSSLLLLMATTGVLGVLAAYKFGRDVLKNSRQGIFSQAFYGCLGAVVVHSFFVNSLFYPWVMGYIAILSAITE